jgi:hypothetical protein
MDNFISTTLAIGDKYLQSAMDFSRQLHIKDPTIKRVVVSDINPDDIPLNTDMVSIENNTKIVVCNTFNYNLKYQAIKACLSYSCKYIIYTDADWILSDQYCSNKINKFLAENSSDIDFFFERPHQIGHSKVDLDSCFWRHKIEPYKLMDTNQYDEAHVCNEQFAIFKNNDKLKFFVEAWAKRNQFCIDNNVWTFAEGVEMGMSAIDAGMLTQWSSFYTINHCFEFYDVLGQHYIRF